MRHSTGLRVKSGLASPGRRNRRARGPRLRWLSLQTRPSRTAPRRPPPSSFAPLAATSLGLVRRRGVAFWRRVVGRGPPSRVPRRRKSGLEESRVRLGVPAVGCKRTAF